MEKKQLKWPLILIGVCFLVIPVELKQLKNIQEKENLGIKFDFAVRFNKKAKSWQVRLFCVLQENQGMTGLIFQWKMKWGASAGPPWRELKIKLQII